ncbi:MAG TPA: ATP-dependent RNA helicase HrpA [Jatrophihabitans sp.]|jgi:ATP-dependent helicase HrpA
MSTSSAPSAGLDIGQLRSRLAGVLLTDEHRLRRRLDDAGRGRNRNTDALTRILADIERSEAGVAAREAAVPRIRYPQDLPVSQRRDDLLAAIRDHQVVVIAGETGSGKTTQLPKICLELGRGVRGAIGHTQPRRIAARAVAERLAEELDVPVGSAVGFAVRFTDRVGEDTLVKLMTDGILLAEIGRDRMLRRYDTIIIDEAHERSLNIDFLLGYLQQLLPRRPDLKVIITSATIDPERFSHYFADAPIVEVSGRSYPVELRYRPLTDPDNPHAEDRDLITAITDAVGELRREPPGDILVFLSGEREIRDTADALNALGLPDTEVLPLYARLSAAEQHRVFARHQRRRIVLATNVAETSLTVPGIKYVIDSGTARVSRYSLRTKVQLLPVEAISQAAATQRAGRCGRTSDGVCIRLYAQDDFEGRPEFTDPEILRTNLASVILQMAALDLGSVQRFGFIDPPDQRQVADGLALLTELGALSSTDKDSGPRLTEQGRRIAQLPLDPRLARMILEADRRGCVRDVLVLTAALSIADPRERPTDAQQAADAKHARFADHTSDFAGHLALWRYIREQQKALSSSQFRRMCRAEYLSYIRVREWQDLFTQLRQIVKGMGIVVGDQPGDIEQIHRSLLAGLLSHIGQRDPDRRDYLGARNARFSIFPGSALFKKQPQFVMAAELVDTSRLWGRVVAGIDPAWAEELAGSLVKRSYSDPHWERARGAVVALERVTLYGVPLIVDRKVGFHTVDPVAARDLFIRHALVEGDWDTRHHFFRRNNELLDGLSDLESRARRRDIVVDDETLFAFYDQRIPDHVVSARHLDSWWKKARHKTPTLLDLTVEDLIRDGAGDISSAQFPDSWSSGDFELDLSYRFEPGAADDGVTVTIPLPLLHSAAEAGLDWNVPGLRAELVTALLRSLPKDIRRGLVPVPDTAAALISTLPDELPTSAGSITDVLAVELQRTRGLLIPQDAWNLDRLPPHLRPTYRVVDTDGRALAEDKDLRALQRRFAGTVAAALTEATADITRDQLADWDFEELPRTVQRSIGGHLVTGYPALAAEGNIVSIRVFDTEQAQRKAMWAGTRQLLVNTLPSPVRQLRNGLGQRTKLVLSRTPHGSIDDLLADCVAAAVEALMRSATGPGSAPAWDRPSFIALREQVAGQLFATTERTARIVEQVILAAQDAELALTDLTGPAGQRTRSEEARHLASLVYPGFVGATDPAQLAHLPRYLRAIEHRASDAATNPSRDAERQAVLDVVNRDFEELTTRLGQDGELALLDRIRWMIEELRVSVFAQQLRTAHPISVKRVHDAMDAIDPR